MLNLNNLSFRKFTLLIIFFSFCLSVIISKYNLNNYDKIVEYNGKKYHQMLKHDPIRYMGHGSEIKLQLDKGINFFKTGRENYTKYLPPRIAALYFMAIDDTIYNDSTKEIKTGIYFPYLIIQCAIFYLSLLLFYNLVKYRFSEKVNFFIILFLALEPTIFQYHSTFWPESIFFSLQIILLGLILKIDKNIFNFFLIGILIGFLSLQKQYAVFLFIPISIFFLYFEKKNKIKKTLILVFGFILLQSFLGLNNYIRSGGFYIITADMKHGAHMDLIAKVISKKSNISIKEFNILEGKAARKWALSENIQFNNEDKNLDVYDFRLTIAEEKDKVKLDNFLAKRSIDYLFENFFDFLKFILKQSIHTALLNPFHIYSDHKFSSGELYYESETHDKLVPIRIIYTLIIFLICLIGIFNLYKKKKIEDIAIIFCFILYFYLFVSWHGNTRYFVPCIIYLSILFSSGIVKILNFNKK